MRTKRRTEITIETDEVTVIRRRRNLARAWCARCAAPVEMVTTEQAAVLTGVSLRRVFRQVEADLLHYTETPDGSLYICLNSLRDERRQDESR